MHPLFIDTLNALSSELESNAIHILTHPKKISEKIESFTMQLVEFKCGVLSLIEKCMRNWILVPSQPVDKNQRMVSEIKGELQKHQDRLNRYRLHQILKRKVYRQKKQSMLGSQILDDNQQFLQMEKSIIMIEKDLGIQNQSDSITQRLGFSTIVSRSLLGEGSPSRNQIHREDSDYSIVSEVSCLPHDTSLVANQNRIDSSLVVPKENLQINYKQAEYQMESKYQKEDKPAKKIISTVKKAKKTVFSKMDSAKQGLLGNLLQQTYNICLEKK